jgi:hypothetical protein
MRKEARPVQYFSDEYLEQCKRLTTEEIVEFLEDFRLAFANQENMEKKDV